MGPALHSLNRTRSCLKVKECMDALAAGSDWQQPTRLQRQQLLEEGTGTQSQAWVSPHAPSQTAHGYAVSLLTAPSCTSCCYGLAGQAAY